MISRLAREVTIPLSIAACTAREKELFSGMANDFCHGMNAEDGGV